MQRWGAELGGCWAQTARGRQKAAGSTLCSKLRSLGSPLALVKWFCTRLYRTVLPASAVYSIRHWTENKRIGLLFAAFSPALAKELGKTPSASISPGLKRDPDRFCIHFCGAHAASQRQPFLLDTKGPALRWQSRVPVSQPLRAERCPRSPQPRDRDRREVPAASLPAAAAPCGPVPASCRAAPGPAPHPQPAASRGPER